MAGGQEPGRCPLHEMAETSKPRNGFIRIMVIAGLAAALAVILHNAWRGRLPVEISGRGLRYADAGAVQSSVDGIRSALGNHDREIVEMRRDIAELKHRRDGVCNS